MKKLFFSSFFVVLCHSAFAQENLWSKQSFDPALIKDKSTNRLSFPKNFLLFQLKTDAFRQSLLAIADKKHPSALIIFIPNSEGAFEQFEMTEASNFDEQLQKQFPQIRAFSGRGLTDPAATLKLSLSPQGIDATIFRTGSDNEFIVAYSANHLVYAVYKSEVDRQQLPWKCTTPDQKMAATLDDLMGRKGTTARSGYNLRTLRLAQSVTAEYSNYFGATSSTQVNLVLAAVNATLSRCNGVYEKDLALHLNLVAASTNVFYYNPATDPYDPASTGAGGTWNTQLQTTLTNVIGEGAYDIGHLFGASGGGGNAGCIGCICVTATKGKGSGFTSPADGIPQGDNFDIDYVVHEVGHQLGANHTFSYANEGSGVNVEVGSGITIMGYAGITSQDVAAHSIDIYHAVSIAQIQANLDSKTCPVTTTLSPSNLTLNAVPNYTIPISTPFALTATATSGTASDVITYCWEQTDNASTAQTGSNSIASPTKATGPNWISVPATTSGTRLFPALATILTGGTTTGPQAGGDAGITTEALSSVARTLNFRVTARNNAPYQPAAPVRVGQTQFTNSVITVTNSSGPFTVTSPNTAVSWTSGSSQTVTWNVASTTAAPVSCANVIISLSTDGGQTFPTVLAANTPNDGSQVVTLPNVTTTTARIKVASVGNIFFDISNANFTIGACNPVTIQASGSIYGSCHSGYQTWNLTTSPPSGATSYLWQIDYLGTNASITFSNPNGSSTLADVKGGGTVKLTYTTCGTSVTTGGPTVYSQCPPGFTVVPNPAKTFIVVSGETELSSQKSSMPFFAVKIIDRFGRIRKSFEYKNGLTQKQIPVSDLNTGTYQVSIWNGHEWISQSLLITK